jgi:hypothetical protein
MATAARVRSPVRAVTVQPVVRASVRRPVPVTTEAMAEQVVPAVTVALAV